MREYECSGIMVDTLYLLDGQNGGFFRDTPVEEIMRIDRAGGMDNVDSYIVPAPVPDSVLNGITEIKHILEPIAKPMQQGKEYTP